MAKDIFGLKISVVVLIFIIVIGSIFLLATSTIGTENKLLGLAIIWVALLPSLIFLQDGDQPPIPFFPLVGIFYALFFGFPVFIGAVLTAGFFAGFLAGVFFTADLVFTAGFFVFTFLLVGFVLVAILGP